MLEMKLQEKYRDKNSFLGKQKSILNNVYVNKENTIFDKIGRPSSASYR